MKKIIEKLKITNFAAFVLILTLAVAGCKKDDDTPEPEPEPIPVVDPLKTSYSLKAKDVLGVTGTVTIAEKSTGSSESIVTITLIGAPANTHPAHIHMNSTVETGAIAYSLNDGQTWTKYSANPVLKNPGISDFRDPKVMWFEPKKKWIMSLSAKENIFFYSSPDLKSWTKESEFGAGRGAHGGGWECPDLVKIDDNGTVRWVLIVNLNPGGPNGGSGTQYFVGDFDGKTFSSDQKDTRWLDYGPDNYAGVTWSNTGNRTLFLGWMSNWLYANEVPSTKWRNAMTLPRELTIKHIGKDIFVSSHLVKEFSKNYLPSVILENIKVVKSFDIAANTKQLKFPYRLNLNADKIDGFSLILSNDKGEEMIIGFDEKQHQYFMDRTKSGIINFSPDYAARHYAPRLSDNTKLNLSLVVDASSVELFADDGLTVMTEIFFPTKPFTKLKIETSKGFQLKKLEYIPLKSIWP